MSTEPDWLKSEQEPKLEPKSKPNTEQVPEWALQNPDWYLKSEPKPKWMTWEQAPRWKRIMEQNPDMIFTKDGPQIPKNPRPKYTMPSGGCPGGPLIITESNRPLLMFLSKIALDHYNQVTCGASFEFDDLVKCTRYYDVFVRPGVHLDSSIYFITFKAKANAKGKEDASDSPDAITIFQASVLVDEIDIDKLPVAEECRIIKT